MAGKSAAVKTDVDAVPSKTDPEEADPGSGSWSDGEISVQTHARLKINQTEVIHQASCTFTYSGGTTGGGKSPLAPIPETVVLNAQGTKLQKGLGHVLINGDTITGPMGNELKIQATSKLNTDIDVT